MDPFDEQMALLVERHQELTRTVETLALEHSNSRERQECADPDHGKTHQD